MTHMTMVKKQVYFPRSELQTLHRLARKKKRRVAALVREAVREVWLNSPAAGPVGLANGELRATSADHDRAFDEP
jgi:hypothetical protein